MPQQRQCLTPTALPGLSTGKQKKLPGEDFQDCKLLACGFLIKKAEHSKVGVGVFEDVLHYANEEMCSK